MYLPQNVAPSRLNRGGRRICWHPLSNQRKIFQWDGYILESPRWRNDLVTWHILSDTWYTNNIRALLTYCLLVFTKSVNSSFRAFLLAPVMTRNILGYSLFCDRSQDGFSFRDIFGRRNLSDKWRSRTNIPKKSWTLVCRCLLVGRKLFSCWIYSKIVKMHLTKSLKCL